jgi:hypothetical protein
VNTLTVFIIAITTSRMIFPGVPPIMPAPDASKPSNPPAARSVSFRLFSSTNATYQSKAEVVVPESLKISNPVRLILDLEHKSSSEPSKTDSSEKFVVKQYWGSAEKVPAGQPRVFMSDETPAASSPREVPDTSYAYWPSPTAENLPEGASAVGTYRLTTNYCGSTTITIDDSQDFLAPIDLIAVPKKANLDEPIKITWKTVPRALGYLVTAFGGNSAESITWTSSSNPAAVASIEHSPCTREEIANLIEKRILLPSHTVSCTIPAGIFKGSSSVFVSITAFGQDKVEKQDAIEKWVIVRSTTGIPIFGLNYKPIVEDEAEKPSVR